MLRSLIIDALIVLTTPLGDPASITGTRLDAAASHWARAYCRMPVDAALATAEKKAASFTRLGLSLTEGLELRDLANPGAVLKREHWAVASRIDGRSSVRDLASDCGIPLHEVFERIGYLVRRGLCARPSCVAAGALATPTLSARMPSASDAVTALAAESRLQAPSAEQLQRILEGLRRL